MSTRAVPPRQRVLIVQGHPDGSALHYGHALAERYRQGALAAGHEVRVIEVARLDFPLLRCREHWEQGPLPAGLQEAQRDLGWAEHIVLFFPLWLGTAPAMLKGFLEQVLRPGFALDQKSGRSPRRRLAGKSARVVVTMGMPALWYRLYFRAHGVRGIERNILAFCGVSPVRESLIGLVEGGASRRETWLRTMERLGRAAK